MIIPCADTILKEEWMNFFLTIEVMKGCHKDKNGVKW